MSRRATQFGLTRRVLTPEYMDAPGVDPDELRKALQYLRRLNRIAGGVGSTVRAFRMLARDLPADHVIRVLDIGTGAGDIPLALTRWAARADRRVHVTAVDVKDEVLAEAQRVVGKAGVAGSGGAEAAQSNVDFVREDATALAYRFDPDSFDITHASLFLHHLNDVQVMTVLRVMQRLGRVGLIWNDLVRSRLSATLARFATLAAPAIVRHDAIVSVQAGFTKREAIELARRTDLENVTYRTCLGYRFVLTSQRADAL